MLQNESVEKNKSIQSLHNQICSFEIEIERQKEMLRNNESKILHLQVRSVRLAGLEGMRPCFPPGLSQGDVRAKALTLVHRAACFSGLSETWGSGLGSWGGLGSQGGLSSQEGMGSWGALGSQVT